MDKHVYIAVSRLTRVMALTLKGAHDAYADAVRDNPDLMIPYNVYEVDLSKCKVVGGGTYGTMSVINLGG